MSKRIAQFSSPPRRSSRRSKNAKIEALSDVTNSSPKPSCHNILECDNEALLETFPEVGFLKMSPSPFHKRHTRNNGSSCKKSLILKRTPKKSKQKLFVTELSSPASSTENCENAAPEKAKLNVESPKKENTEEKESNDAKSRRRSKRKTKTTLEKEEEGKVIAAINNGQCAGLTVQHFENRGRGVVATKPFSKGEFVVEYEGDLIKWETAQEREKQYSLRPNVGCYMYYFSTAGYKFCIDGTEETGKFGRLCNHSRRNPNCHTKIIWIRTTDEEGQVDMEPHLIIVALRDIIVGEEITYDYGDRDKEAIECHPWLKN